MKIEGIPNFAAKFYSLIAKKSPCIRDIHTTIAQEVCSEISSGAILDVGTGPGYLPLEIAKRNINLEIIGIDLSSGMVKIATANAEKSGVSDRVKFQVANAASLPFKEGRFDLVISSLSLHHWRNPPAYIKEIHRVLKPHGRAFIYDIRRDTSKEINAKIHRQYGWFLSFLFLKIVRAHSSITLKEAQGILSSLEVNYVQKSVEEQGVILKLQLLKD
jgi:ubiquinone/menaquinone biosynthesis C-methylase UbiE